MAARASVWLNERLLSGQGWLSLVLVWLSLVLFSATLPWQNARWDVSLPPLFWVAISGLLVGLFVSQLGIRALWRHVIGALSGAGITIALVATTLPVGGWLEKVGQVTARTQLWFAAAQEGWSNNDLMVLVLFLSATSWLLGYLGAWSILVWRKAFIVVLAAGVLVLEGLYYVPQPASIFFVYLWASLMLVMQLSLTPRDNPSGLRPAHQLGLLAMAALLVLLVWRVPLPGVMLKGSDLWQKIPPWREVVVRTERMFPVLAISKQEQGRDSGDLSYGATLGFGGAIQRTGEVLFKVEVPGASEGRGRWRAIAYDVYTSQGWLSGEQESDPASNLEGAEKPVYQSRQDVTQTIELLVRSDLLVASGQPLGASIAASAEGPAPVVYTILIPGGPKDDNQLPADVKAAAAQLRKVASGGELSASRISSSLPPGFKTVGLELKGSELAAVRIQRETTSVSDITALRTPYLLRPPTKYTVVSSEPRVTAKELAASKAPLPDWVQERYLALPATLPERVRQLAARITWTWGEGSYGAQTEYEKTLAIQEYVRQLTYSYDIKAPPLDMDAVDYFLFISKTGYSQYFSSAMVVMLRSVGVPARLALGFVSDEYDLENRDPDKAVYIVRDSGAHGWVEVFFPEYGWVEFEPTPGWTIELPAGDIPTLGAGTGDPLGDPEAEPEAALTDGSLGLGSSALAPVAGLPGATPTPAGSTPGPAGQQPGAPTPGPSPAPTGAAGESPEGAAGSSAQRGFLETALVVLGILLVLALGLILWWRSWGAKGDEGEAYARLVRVAGWGRVRSQPSLTPVEYGDLLIAALPSRGKDIHLIVDTYDQWLYGKRGGSQEARRQLQSAWLSLRGELLKRILRPW